MYIIISVTSYQVTNIEVIIIKTTKMSMQGKRKMNNEIMLKELKRAKKGKNTRIKGYQENQLLKRYCMELDFVL